MRAAHTPTGPVVTRVRGLRSRQGSACRVFRGERGHGRGGPESIGIHGLSRRWLAACRCFPRITLGPDQPCPTEHPCPNHGNVHTHTHTHTLHPFPHSIHVSTMMTSTQTPSVPTEHPCPNHDNVHLECPGVYLLVLMPPPGGLVTLWGRGGGKSTHVMLKPLFPSVLGCQVIPKGCMSWGTVPTTF